MALEGTYTGRDQIAQVVDKLMDSRPTVVTIHAGPQCPCQKFRGITVPRGTEPTESHETDEGHLKLFITINGRRGRWPFHCYRGKRSIGPSTIHKIKVH